MIAPQEVGLYWINSAQDTKERNTCSTNKDWNSNQNVRLRIWKTNSIVEKCPNMASTEKYERITQSYNTLNAMDEILGHTNLKNAYRTSNIPSLFTMNLILVIISLSYQMTFMYNLYLNIILYYYTILYNCYECCTKAKLNNNNSHHKPILRTVHVKHYSMSFCGK